MRNGRPVIVSNGFAAVKTALNNIVPDHGTPMRSAIYKSVNEIISRGRSQVLLKPLFSFPMETTTGMVTPSHGYG